MKGVTKRDHNMHVASRAKHPKAFGNGISRTLNVFKYRIAFDSGDGVVCKGETVDVRNYIDTRSGKQVDIQE